MANTYFLGMRGTNDFAENEAPENWRQGILTLYPNGSAPLTALTALMPSEQLTKGPHFHWWTRVMPTQRVDITGVYTNAALSSAYASGGVAGTVLYLKTSDATNIVQFRAGHVVVLRDADDFTLDTNAFVLEVVVNGTSSYIAVRLLEADDNSNYSHTLANADVAFIIGSAHAQGASRPTSVVTKPTELDNYTQIFRNSLDLTRTALMTGLRTENAYQSAKSEALEQHSVEEEKGFLFGKKATSIGDNGKLITFTNGIIPSIIENASANAVDYRLLTDTEFAGVAWKDGGEDFLDKYLEQIFRVGSDERLAFMGSGALLGINALIKKKGQFQFNERTMAYGIKVTEWVTPFGVVYFKRHPLFSYEETLRYSGLFFEPANLNYVYITDTVFKPDKAYDSGASTPKDGKEEEYLTEAGLEHHFPETCGFFNGIGLDNLQS